MVVAVLVVTEGVAGWLLFADDADADADADTEDVAAVVVVAVDAAAKEDNFFFLVFLGKSCICVSAILKNKELLLGLVEVLSRVVVGSWSLFLV